MHDSQQKSKAKPATFLQPTFRLALVFSLGWLGLNTAMSIKTLLAPPPVSRSELPTIVDNVNLLTADGSWRFDESQAMIATSLTDDPQISATSNRHETTLSIDEPTIKAFLEMDKHADLTSATLAIKAEDKWQVLELGSTVSQPATPHLLPLGTSKRICGRWSDDDRLLLEIVSVDVKGRELLDAWRMAGWQIRHTTWGGLNSFSYLCVRKGQIVYAWSQHPQHIKSLLLSSSPDVTLRGTTSNNGKQL